MIPFPRPSHPHGLDVLFMSCTLPIWGTCTIRLEDVEPKWEQTVIFDDKQELPGLLKSLPKKVEPKKVDSTPQPVPH